MVKKVMHQDPGRENTWGYRFERERNTRGDFTYAKCRIHLQQIPAQPNWHAF